MDVKRRKRKTPPVLWALLVVALVLALGSVVMVAGIILPYQNAESAMPAGGRLLIEQQPEGELKLSWPAADRADYYCLEIEIPAGEAGGMPELIYKDYIEGANFCLLQELPGDMELTVRISSAMTYSVFGKEKIRLGDRNLEITTVFSTPRVENLRWEADPESQSIRIDFETAPGNQCRYYLLNEAGEVQESRILEGNTLELAFGQGMDYPLPEHGQQYHMAFDAYREEPGLQFYGYRSGAITVTRDDLLSRSLNLTCTDDGQNRYTLSWEETKGDYYEVQTRDSSGKLWVTVARVELDEERIYSTGRMPPFEDFTYRVVAAGGQLIEGSEYAAVSDEVTVQTRESPVFATIWPTDALTAYSDPGMTEEAGKVTVGEAYCVLEEVDGMFAIRLDGQKAYIDSNYCMINLPEYMGSLCAYQITNSYSSLYMVHEFEIPKVTDVVTGGYEQVQLQDGTYLVPLLYPTAKKLVNAALAARDMGYRLKIYDAFRPNKATKEIYDLTNQILDRELPEKTFTGVSVSSLKLPAPQEVPVKFEEGEDGSTVPVEVKKMLTYRMVMLGENYTLNYFLAKGGSLHNLGIALDLTLEELDSGSELKMQTSMHDLSQYSVLSRNNSPAKDLAAIMKGAGFGDLISEWWHFQDNEARNTLSPPTVYGGVSANCWMADDQGWRYRTRNGTYYTGETVTIDEVQYTFDENGYLME